MGEILCIHWVMRFGNRTEQQCLLQDLAPSGAHVLFIIDKECLVNDGYPTYDSHQEVDPRTRDNDVVDWKQEASDACEPRDLIHNRQAP